MSLALALMVPSLPPHALGGGPLGSGHSASPSLLGEGVAESSRSRISPVLVLSPPPSVDPHVPAVYDPRSRWWDTGESSGSRSCSRCSRASLSRSREARGECCHDCTHSSEFRDSSRSRSRSTDHSQSCGCERARRTPSRSSDRVLSCWSRSRSSDHYLVRGDRSRSRRECSRSSGRSRSRGRSRLSSNRSRFAGEELAAKALESQQSCGELYSLLGSRRFWVPGVFCFCCCRQFPSGSRFFTA